MKESTHTKTRRHEEEIVRLTTLKGGNELIERIAESIFKSMSFTNIIDGNKNMELAIFSTVTSTIHILTLKGFIKEEMLINNEEKA